MVSSSSWRGKLLRSSIKIRSYKHFTTVNTDHTPCESMDKLISTISCCCQPTVPLLRIATYHFIHTGHTSCYCNKIHNLQLLLNQWTQTKYSSTTTTYVFLLVVCVTIVEHEMKVIDAFLCTWILLQFQLLLYCTHVHRMLYYTIIVL